MAAEPSQTEKSPVAVLTQGDSLEGGDGDNAVVVVASDKAKKRQSLSDIFTIVGFHCGDCIQFDDESCLSRLQLRLSCIFKRG